MYSNNGATIVSAAVINIKQWPSHNNSITIIGADTILQVDHSDGGFGPLYWVVGSKKETSQIFVKMVNTGSEAEKVSFNLKNAAIHSQGVARVISGSSLNDENTKDKSTVTVKESTFKMDTLTSFTYTFEPYSATVLLLHLQK